MWERTGVLGGDVLIQATAEGDVKRLHAAADTEERKIRGFGQLCHFQVEGGTPLAHHLKFISLPLAIELGSEVRTATRQKETIDVSEQTPAGA